MRLKLRKITIDNQLYLWQTGYGDPFLHMRTRYIESFTAYLEGYKKSPLRIYFRQGLELENGSYNRDEKGVIQFDINLEAYVPKGTACFIRYGLNQGWKPKEDVRPFTITDAREVLALLEQKVTVN